MVDEIGRVTTYSYDANKNLQSITYHDKKACGFAYDAAHKLIAVRNIDTRKIEYTYENDFHVPRVSKISQRGDDRDLSGAAGETGYEMAIRYENGNTTVFTEPGLDGVISTDSDNRITTYHFDNMGRPFDVIHDDGSANNFQYYSEGMKNNRLGKSGATQKTVYSLLKNPCADKSQLDLGFDAWETYKSADTTSYYAKNHVEVTNIDQNVRYKELGLSFYSVASYLTQNKNGLSQNILLQPGTYTFSAYASLIDCSLKAGSESGAYIEIMDLSDQSLAKSRVIKEISDTNLNGGWERLSATFTLNTATTVKAAGIIDGIRGTAYFTGLQLEAGSATNNLNLINNPGFRKIENGIPIGWTYSPNVTEAKYEQTADRQACAKLVGDVNEEKVISQSVNVHGEEGDVYCLSGWAEGTGIPGHKFMLAAKVIYEDYSVKWHEFEFNPNVGDQWQFVNGTFRTDDDNGDVKKKYIAIEVCLIYHNQANPVLFDGIQLIRDDGASYVYDDNGNLVSAKSAAESSGFVSDSKDNLTKMGDIKGTSFEYVYDDKKHVTTAKNSQGIRYQFQYNEQGKPVSTVVQGGKMLRAVIPGRTYYIREKMSGNYLHVADELTTSGASVVLGNFNGSTASQWTLVDNPDGQYLLVPKHAETLCLHLKDASDTDGAVIQVCTKDGSDAQHWKLHPIEDGFSHISCKATNNKKGLTNRGSSTVNGHAVVNYTLNEDYYNQEWYFEPVPQEGETYSDAPEAGKIYSFRVRHSGQYLGIANVDSNNLEYAKSQFFNGSDHQQFYLEAASDAGYYFLHPVSELEQGSQKVLAGGNLDTEGNITLWLAEKDASNPGQLFRFDRCVNGQTYLMVCMYENRAIDVKNVSYVNGAPLILMRYGTNPGKNKQWILEEVSDRITSSMTYTANKKHVASVTDSRGNSITNTYDTNDRLLLSTKDAENNITTYGYDVNDRLVSVSAANGTQTAAVSYEYTDDRLTGISHNGTEYEFDYDEFGNRTCTKAGGAALVTSEYRPHNGLLEKQTYGNGYELRNEYNKKEQLIAQHGKEYGKTEQQLFKNMYDDNGSLISHSDMENELRTDFQYDMIGRMTGSEKYSTKTDDSKDRKDMSQRISYDDKNRVSEYVQKLEGESAIRTGYRYGDPSKGEDPGLIYGITEGNVEKITYVYDDLGRVAKKILNPSTSMERVTEYTYVAGAKTGTTTLLVETVKEDGFQYHYIYDKRGNITRIRKSNPLGTEVFTNYYFYDALGQLIREDNGETGKRVVYTYDAGGNITNRKIYPYANGVAGSLADTENYVYSSSLANSTSGINANWKDLLISYGDEQSSYIRYDEIGNARTYRGRVLSWTKGKNLDNISGTNLNISFKYDQNGVRIAKESVGKTVKYHTDGSRIMALEYNNHLVQFLYNQEGTPFGLRYKQYGSEVLLDYYYVHNMQGDVIGIVDSNGNQVVTYQYDSWGVPVSVTDNSGCNLSVLNPFRYRGYVYDDETGYYYLKSRYYDPESGRFLSADNIISDAQGILGFNVFCYCDNNPVNHMDPLGYLWKRIGKWVKKKVKQYLNPSNFWGTVVSGLDITANALKSSVTKAIRTSVRPANIGIGTYAKQCAEELESISRFGKTSTKVLSVASYAIGAIDVAIGIYDNIEKGATVKETVLDATVDVAVTGGSIWVAGEVGSAVGAAVGTVVPGAGNVVGAVAGFVIGIGIYAATDMVLYDGKTGREWMKEGLNNLW